MYCEHTHERFVNVNGTTIMWDVQAITDKTLLSNQPDRVLHDNTCLSIDTALPDDSYINTKGTEKN
jgi:hypothetical protein